MKLPYAEDIGHYWETSGSSADSWMEKTKRLIRSLNGKILAEGFGAVEGRSAYMMAFQIGDDQFKVVWPVLLSRAGRVASARRQAATMLHHDIKAKVMTASVLGTRAAFFSYLLLPDGRAANEAATPELARAFPMQLVSGQQ